MLSREQALTAGLSQAALHRRVAGGRWEAVLPAVYRVTGTPSSWEQDLMAACLHGGRGSFVSHRTAAALWRLDGLEPGIVEIAASRRVRIPGIVAHGTRVPRRHLTAIGPIPVSRPGWTLLDLVAVASPALAEIALDDALRRGLTTLRRLARLLEAHGGPGRRGSGVLRSLLEARDPSAAPPESVLETRLARLLARSGLPRPVTQHEVRAGGRLVARVDFAWPEAMVAVEADGYRHHSGRRAWARDRTRRNALTGLGWRVLHVTWDDLRRRPEATLAEIRQALRFSGH